MDTLFSVADRHGSCCASCRPRTEAQQDPLSRLRTIHSSGCTARSRLPCCLKQDPDLIIGARNGPPLAVGHGDGEMYLGSDAIALGARSPMHDHLSGRWRLGDHCGAAEWRYSIIAGNRGRAQDGQVDRLRFPCRERETTGISWKRKSMSSRKSISHTMSHYIDFADGSDQEPRPAVSILPKSTAWPSRPAARLPMPVRPPNTGSSAMRVCRWTSISPRSSVTARSRLSAGDLALFISQSGETADTLASLRYCKAKLGMPDRCGGQCQGIDDCPRS